MIIAVWGPAQSGKTTLAANFSEALAKEGNNVCLVSAEMYGEIGLVYGVRVPLESSISQAAKWERNIREVMPQTESGVNLLCPSTEGSAFTYTISDTQAQQLLKVVDSLFDYVIVDCTSELSNAITGTALAIANAVLLSVGGRITAYAWAKAYEVILQELGPRMACVRNMNVKDFDYSFFDTRLDTIWFTMELPYVSDMEVFTNSGKLAYNASNFEKGVRGYRKSIDTIVKEVEDRNGIFSL